MDNGEETYSMASGHASSSGFSYILPANGRSRRSTQGQLSTVGKNKFGGKHAARKKRMKES